MSARPSVDDRWWRDSYELGRLAGLDNLLREVPKRWKFQEKDWLSGYDCGQRQYREAVDNAFRSK